jgi:hypothetical protein
VPYTSRKVPQLACSTTTMRVLRHRKTPETTTTPEAEGSHNIVIAYLPACTYGVTCAKLVAALMRRTFPSLRIGLMVGIGGGVLSEEHGIRLDDVVVSRPTGQYGGVIQYAFWKTLSGRFERIGSLNKPPTTLMNAVSQVKLRHEVREPKFYDYLPDMATRNLRLSRYIVSPGSENDQLFKANYDHPSDEAICTMCWTDPLLSRPWPGGRRRRGDRPADLYGLIALGDQVMKNAVVESNSARNLTSFALRWNLLV